MGKKVHYAMLKENKMGCLCNQVRLTSENKITNDYFKVTCKNCKDILELEILKIPLNKRSESEHRILVKHFGGVRPYLLTLGEFKDAEKENIIDIPELKIKIEKETHHKEKSYGELVEEFEKDVKEFLEKDKELINQFACGNITLLELTQKRDELIGEDLK